MPILIVETPEGVPLRNELAGAGSRAAAAQIDLAIAASIWLLAIFVAIILASVDPSGMGGALQAGLGAGSLLYFTAYFALFGIFWSGQTPGKWVLGLAVADAEGYPATPTQHLLRSLFWPLETLLMVPLPLGLLVIAASSRRQRIGDLVAGTVVVRRPQLNDAREPWPRARWSSMAGRQQPLVPALAARLDNRDFEFLRALLVREGLTPAKRRELFTRAARHYAQRLGLEPVHDVRAFLKELYLFLRETRTEQRPAAPAAQ